MTSNRAAAAAARRVAIGFSGGQVLTLRLPEKELAGLRKALNADGDKWYEVSAIDGAVMVEPSQVVYLRVEADDARVGF